MKADLYLHNGLIVTENSAFRGGVAVKDGRVSHLVSADAAVDAGEAIDLDGKVLLPGVVDDHAHFNEPGRTEWEGFVPGSMAAAAGGVTMALEMPLNCTPPTIDRVQLARKREAAAGASVVDYAFWGGLVDNNLEHLSDLHAEGVIGYKAFMSNAGTDFARVNDDVLYMGLKQVRDLGNVVGLHAENEFVNAYLARQFMDAGRVDTFSWTASRPPEGELEAINRAIFWAKIADARLHIVHVSIAEGMRAVARARYSGAKVTAETCPHYLLLDSDDFAKLGAEAKCAPPIRPREEVEALWECVLDGLVDTIASDHSPCPIADKQRGAGNIWEAWGGITGIQTMLPAMLTEGVHRRGLDLTHLARLLSTNPARIFGVYPKKGVIAPGADADFAVVDLDKEWVLSAGDLFSRNKHSAFVGRTFRGRVERTIVRGVTVYQAGQIVAQPGFGQLVLRQG